MVGREGDASKFIAQIYASIGCEVDLFAVEPGRENAVGVLRGTGGGRSLIYNGHVDVVPPGDPAIWTGGNPFSGRNDGQRVWGRGASDMKGGLIAQAFAVRALSQAGVKLNGDLIIEAVVGEEVMDHEAGVTATIKRGYVADAAVVSPSQRATGPARRGSGQPGPVVVLGHRARQADPRVDARQPHPRGGLGAEVGVNAIDKGVDMFLAMRRLEDEWGQTKRHALFPAGPLHDPSGRRDRRPEGRPVVPFIVSEFMTIEYCCWYHPEEDPEAVKREIEEHIQRAAQLDPWLREHPPVIDWKLNWPAFSVDPKHPICTAIGDAHEIARVRGHAVRRPTGGQRVCRGRGLLVPQPGRRPHRQLRPGRPARRARRRRACLHRRARDGDEDLRAPRNGLVRPLATTPPG